MLTLGAYDPAFRKMGRQAVPLEIRESLIYLQGLEAFFFSNSLVYMCVYICSSVCEHMRVQVNAHVCAHAGGGQRLMLGVVLHGL